MRRWTTLMWCAVWALAALPAAAQDPTAPADSAVVPAPPPPPPPRASWLSDRMSLRPGDLLTVVVDERTAARERVSKIATGNREQRGIIRATLDTDNMNYGVTTGLDKNSRDVGEANRQGDLTAVLSVRVVRLEDNGLARIQGSKHVTVDGRLQEVTIEGVIRTQDIERSNMIRSDRIAEAVITYKGKQIGPRSGILGSILGMLWP